MTVSPGKALRRRAAAGLSTAAAGPLGGRRVLIIVENLPAPFDRRVWQEALALRAHGAEVAVICPTGGDCTARYEEIDGIHIYRHALPVDAAGPLGYLVEYSTALFWEWLLAWKVLLRHGFDVIHACNPPDNIFLIAGFFKLLLGKRFLFDHHDINPELYEAKFGRRDLFYRLMRLWERWTFRTADVSIATNGSYRRIAIERGHMPAERVFVVRSGPDLQRLQPLPPVEALKHGRRYLVGYVGVMGTQEGLDYLLDAARHIVHELRRDDVQFTLVGGGPKLEALQQRACELGLAAYVNFTGRVPDRTLCEVLSTADVCVNPDEVNEMNDKSTMNKVMEYMALGKPIVQFDVTEGRLSAQAASLYARPNDPVDLAGRIVELLEDPERRAQMGAFGRKRVETELAWDYEVPKLIAAYQALWSAAAPRA